MLGRRHYRIKVFQALYAWYQGGEQRQDVAERMLMQSIEKIYELYFLQISFFLEVIDFYRRRQEDAKLKFIPTEEELNPNTKLVENKLINLLSANRDLEHQLNKYKISWTEEQEMIRKVFMKIRESKDLKEYLESGNNSFEEDSEIVYKIFRKFIAKSPELQFFCEERSIFWYDDFQAAALFVLKTIKMIKADFPPSDSLISLFVKDEDDDPDEDIRFIKDLFHKCISQDDMLNELIQSKTKNWELERIALTDIIFLKMALTELLQMPEIPVKVSLNEYIELSKLFSTPKSKVFINGLLDKMVEDLRRENKLVKKGRGLI